MIYCICRLTAVIDEKEGGENTVVLTPNSYLDTLLSNFFDIENYGLQGDNNEDLTVLEKLSVPNFNNNHEIRDMCDGTKLFFVKLNRLPIEHTPTVNGNLSKTYARWAQLERRFMKTPKVAEQFKNKFDDLIAKGIVGYVGGLNELRHMYEGEQMADNEHIFCPLQIVMNQNRDKMRIVLYASYPNQLLYSGRLLLPNVVENMLRFRFHKY